MHRILTSILEACARARQPGVVGALLLTLLWGCTPSKTALRTDLERTVAQDAAALGPSAAPVPGLTVAVSTPEAPGYNVEDLSARVRVALQRGSGVAAVDALSVQAELGACTVAPCAEALAAQYRDAQYVCASSLSRIGDVFIVSVRVQHGIEEVARANAEDKDARVAIMHAAYAAGQALRAAVSPAVLSPAVLSPAVLSPAVLSPAANQPEGATEEARAPPPPTEGSQ